MCVFVVYAAPAAGWRDRGALRLSPGPSWELEAAVRPQGWLAAVVLQVGARSATTVAGVRVVVLRLRAR